MQPRALFLCAFLLVPAHAAFADAKPPAKGAKPVAAAPAAAPELSAAHADLKDAAGAAVGSARLQQTPHGILVTLDIKKLPPGQHAFHIHETGKCEPPFKSAGGHFNPTGHKHGVLSPEGKHGGDLPNIHVAGDGTAMAQFFVPDLTLQAGEKTSVVDADGAALVIHAVQDDYKSDPAGAAGDRIACGVIVLDKTAEQK